MNQSNLCVIYQKLDVSSKIVSVIICVCVCICMHVMHECVSVAISVGFLFCFGGFILHSLGSMQTKKAPSNFSFCWTMYIQPIIKNNELIDQAKTNKNVIEIICKNSTMNR